MDDIERLRSLLGLTEDRDVADQVSERVVDRELRAKDIAEVLPEAVRQAEHAGRLTPSLEAPIEQTLRKSITKNPETFAEILFPVMGPAIRRSIADTLRVALEGLNQALDIGLSARGLRWRLESWRTGVPFREVVLRHTMAYRVREAFLISKHSGLLMVRAGDPGSEALDRDAVAAMLTAVEDFVADSTGAGDKGELSSAELGGHVVWVLSGYAARLALVVEGQPPRSVKGRLQELLESLHRNYGPWMEAFEGGATPDPAMVEEVSACLLWESQDNKPEDKKKGVGLPAVIFLSIVSLGLISWLVWSMVETRRQAARWEQLQSLLGARPGLVYLSAARRDDVLEVNILADPAAAAPYDLEQQAGYEPGQLKWVTHRFLSTDPEMIAERLRRALAPLPAGIVISSGESAVAVSGDAPSEWIAQLRRYVRFQLDPEQIQMGSLVESAGNMTARIRAALKPPPGIEIDTVPGAGIRVNGTGGGAWRTQAEALLGADFPQVTVDWSTFEDGRALLEAAGRRLEEQAVYFQPGQTSNDEFQPLPVARILNEIRPLAAHCECRFQLRVVGCSDDSGSAAVNESVRRKRARWLRQQLAREDSLSASMDLETTCSGAGEESRRAFVKIEIE